MFDLIRNQEIASLIEKFGEGRVVIEIAEIRLEEIVEELQSLRYLHSASRENAVFAKLHSHEIRQAFVILQLDIDAFESEARQIVMRLRTTRPDGVKRAPGAGRPRRQVCTLPLFEGEENGGTRPAKLKRTTEVAL
jgi:hypothetical protein